MQTGGALCPPAPCCCTPNAALLCILPLLQLVDRIRFLSSSCATPGRFFTRSPKLPSSILRTSWCVRLRRDTKLGRMPYNCHSPKSRADALNAGAVRLAENNRWAGPRLSRCLHAAAVVYNDDKKPGRDTSWHEDRTRFLYDPRPWTCYRRAIVVLFALPQCFHQVLRSCAVHTARLVWKMGEASVLQLRN